MWSIYLKYEIQKNVHGACKYEGDGQQLLVRPPDWILDQSRDATVGMVLAVAIAVTILLQDTDHVSGLRVAEDVWPGPGHLGTLVRSGEDGAGGTTLAHGGRSHEDEGDTLGHHGPGSEDAEQDEDGGQDVSEDQLEGDIEGVGGTAGGQDADIAGSGLDGSSDGKLWRGGE